MATTVDLIRIRPARPADAPAIAHLIRRENHRQSDGVAIAASLAWAPSVVAHEGPELVAFFYGRPFAPDIHVGASPERCIAARAFWLRMGWHIVLATGGSVVLARWLGAPRGPVPSPLS